MSAASNPWNRLSLSGKIVLPLVALLILGTVGLLVLWLTGIGPQVLDWLIATAEANIEILRFVVAATAILLFTVPAAFLIIFMELKIIAIDEPAHRSQPDRSVGHTGVHGGGSQGVGQGRLHTDRRGCAGIHPGAGSGVSRGGPDPGGHPLRPGHGRVRHGAGAAVLLRHRWSRRGRPDDGWLVQLQQVLAAGRPARGGRGHQL